MQIKSIKKKGQKYSLEFDDNSKINTYDEVILNNRLLYNKNVNVELLEKIDLDTVYYNAYYKVINYISIRIRSEKEINEYIDKLKVDEKNKNMIIKKLKQLNLINDFNFAKAYVNDKINLSNDGPNKIRSDLEKHNITDDIINDILLGLDNNIIKEKLKRIMKKKIKTIKYNGFKLKEKLVQQLTYMGFNYDVICDVYNEIGITKDSSIIDEYQKLNKKLGSKYSDKELKLYIKKKLYQKGYSIDEINEVIDN